MKLLYPLSLLFLLAAAPAAAQLTVTGNTTRLTVDGLSTIKAGTVQVSNGATIDLKGANSSLTGTTLGLTNSSTLEMNGLNSSLLGGQHSVLSGSAIEMNGTRARVAPLGVTIGENSRVTMTGGLASIDTDDVIIGEEALLEAPASNYQIQASFMLIEDGGVFSAPSFAGEIFIYDDFQIDGGGTFTTGGYVECTDIEWNGETIFLIGSDESAGDYATVLAQGVTSIDGELTTALAGGYEPLTNQRYRLIDLDDQFSSAGFSATAPNDNWSYDVEQNYVDVIFDATSLPVEWLGFTGQWTGKAAQLDWETATEIGSDYFDVERQNPAGSWDAIGQVRAAGESITPKAYEFLDTDPGPTNPILYRLRQVDLDGAFTYSEIVSLARSATEGTISLYPNPAKGHIFVEGMSVGDFQITDAAGREVARGQINDTYRVRIALPDELPMGTYILRSESGSAQRFTVTR